MESWFSESRESHTIDFQSDSSKSQRDREELGLIL